MDDVALIFADICHYCNSFGIQTQATLVEGEGSHRCAILVPTYLLSVAYLRVVPQAIKGSEPREVISCRTHIFSFSLRVKLLLA